MQEQWGKNLIRSWNDHWLDLPKRLATKLAQLLNVNAREVLVGESTSVNLYKVAHALIQSGHYPKQFLTDSLNFPTDNYILEGISRENNLAKAYLHSIHLRFKGRSQHAQRSNYSTPWHYLLEPC